MSGTLNSIPLVGAALVEPAWGIWQADVVAASGELQSGAATLELGGRKLQGTIIGGGVAREEGRYRLVAGAGGWRKPLPSRAYKNGGGVRLETVLSDLAREAGEKLGTVDQAKRIGKAFVRQAGVGTLALNELVTEGWYVDDAGVTQIGTRPASSFAEPFVLMGERTNRGLVTLAAEAISGLRPGVTIKLDSGTIRASSIRHELTQDTLRSHVWGAAAGDRFLDAFRVLVEWIMGRTFYLGAYEYVVRSHASGYVDCDPARGDRGLPRLANVPVWSGIPGGGGEAAVGAGCIVRFLDGDPTRPVVEGFEGEWGSSWAPTTCRVGGDDALVRDAPFAQWVTNVETAITGVGGAVAPNMALIQANPTYGPHATQKTRGA